MNWAVARRLFFPRLLIRPVIYENFHSQCFWHGYGLSERGSIVEHVIEPHARERRTPRSCTHPASRPATAAAAAGGDATRGLRYLNAVDATGLTSVEQAECLRGLGQAEAMHTAARSRVLAAFSAAGRV